LSKPPRMLLVGSMPQLSKKAAVVIAVRGER